jgi:hypothetical protein
VSVPPLPRRAFHRALFALAGAYNLLWGAFTLADPQWLFRFAGMPLANHPAVFAALGMVVGLYGFVYLEVARRPERGFPLVAVGLAGKLFGPLGLCLLIARGEWPLRSVVLCAWNDVIWWLPFGFYLRDAWPAFRADLRE